jgi:hypothetical protein
MMPRDYVTYDELEDVLTSTDLLALVAPKLHEQPSYWKWAIVAAQNGLQGAMVCALHDAIGVSVLDERSGKRLLEWHDSGRKGKIPTERLAGFRTLFERFCSQYPQPQATRQQIRDVLRLHKDFRNNFEHFTPQSWSLQKAGLPRIVGTAIDLIEIAMTSESVVHRLSGNTFTRKSHDCAARFQSATCRCRYPVKSTLAFDMTYEDLAENTASRKRTPASQASFPGRRCRRRFSWQP